jgi:hypothetical protein
LLSSWQTVHITPRIGRGRDGLRQSRSPGAVPPRAESAPPPPIERPAPFRNGSIFSAQDRVELRSFCFPLPSLVAVARLVGPDLERPRGRALILDRAVQRAAAHWPPWHTARKIGTGHPIGGHMGGGADSQALWNRASHLRFAARSVHPGQQAYVRGSSSSISLPTSTQSASLAQLASSSGNARGPRAGVDAATAPLDGPEASIAQPTTANKSGQRRALRISG